MENNTVCEVSKNSAYGVANRVLTIILGLIFRKIFILYLGESISGLSSLYTNLLNFLGLATAGLSVSSLQKIFVFSAKEDYESIKKIEDFTNRFYRMVSIVIIATGLMFTLFLDKIIYNNTYDIIFLKFVFLIQVISECIGYLFYSKKLILQAYAKLYIISIIEMVVNTVFYAVQIFLIVIFKKYLIYVITIPIKYFIIGYIEKEQTLKHYTWLCNKTKASLKEMSYVFGDVKNTVVMQISQFIFLSTDSIVISKFLGLVSVNSYDNYMIIVNSLTSVVDEINGALRTSFGIRLAKDGSAEAQSFFVDSNTLLGHFIGSFFGVSFFCIADIFISLWLGDKFIINQSIVILLTANFYVNNLGSALKNFMSITGCFKTDKIIMLTAALTNILLSIILVQYIGLSGVVIGTLVGNLVMLLARSIYFYDSVVKQSFFQYLFNLTEYALLFVLEICFVRLVMMNFLFDNVIIKMIVAIVLCSTIPNIVNYLIFRKKSVVELIRKRIVEGFHL